MLTPKTFSGVSFGAIDNDKDVTKDRNLNTFKMYCKRRKSGVRFPDRKAKIVCVRVIALLAMKSHFATGTRGCASRKLGAVVTLRLKPSTGEFTFVFPATLRRIFMSHNVGKT